MSMGVWRMGNEVVKIVGNECQERRRRTSRVVIETMPGLARLLQDDPCFGALRRTRWGGEFFGEGLSVLNAPLAVKR